MIGQRSNLEKIKKWRLNKSVPRYIIIEGAEGSGRLTLAKVVIKMLNATGIIVGNGINDVREMIDNCYQNVSKTVYIFRDCDDMSIPAKNSLLKVVEEPPNNCYIIMTVRDINNMLDTLKSRASYIKMEPYGSIELKELTDNELFLNYLHTPGQILNANSQDLGKALEMTKEILVALFDLKSGTTILKVCTGLKAKPTDEKGLDCLLFFDVLVPNLIDSLYRFKICKPSAILRHISYCRRELNNKSINKKGSIEAMLIKILEEIKGAGIS